MRQMEGGEVVTPGEVLGKASELRAGKGAYVSPETKLVYASLTGRRSILSPVPDSNDQRPIVEITGHKAHSVVPEPGCTVIARVKKVMAKTASADIMCVDAKSVREKFTGIIRQQDVRATEIDKVDMHTSFRVGDIVRATVTLESPQWEEYNSSHSPIVIPNGIHEQFELSPYQRRVQWEDARAYYLSTAKNELGVVSAPSAAGAIMIPISWTEMQCPLTGQIEKRKVAKVQT